jgi:hypothetical protein
VLEDRRAAFCARLKASRERKGVSLEDIAAPTKISRSLLKGLEDNDLSRWPQGLYRRSYLRDYLRAIDLLEESIVTEFVRLFPDEQSLPAEDLADSAESEEPCALSLMLEEDSTTRFARARKRMAAAVVDIVVVLTLSGAAWWTMNTDIWASGALVTLSYYSIGTAIFGYSLGSRAFENNSWRNRKTSAFSSAASDSWFVPLRRLASVACNAALFRIMFFRS